MKGKFFEILSLNNFNTKVVPEMFLTHMDLNQIGLSKNMLFRLQNLYNGQKYYFFNDFLPTRRAQVQSTKITLKKKSIY